MYFHFLLALTFASLWGISESLGAVSVSTKCPKECISGEPSELWTECPEECKQATIPAGSNTAITRTNETTDERNMKDCPKECISGQPSELWTECPEKCKQGTRPEGSNTAPTDETNTKECPAECGGGSESDLWYDCPEECKPSGPVKVTNTTSVKPTDASQSQGTKATVPFSTSTTTSSPPSSPTTESVTIQKPTELDKTLHDFYQYNDKKIDIEAVDECYKARVSMDDCAHLKTNNYKGNSHTDIHNYIFNKDTMLADDEYEYYRVAPWDVVEPAMYSEKATINGETWYRRPHWAKDLHVKESDYPKGFPVQWIWFQDSQEEHDD